GGGVAGGGGGGGGGEVGGGGGGGGSHAEGEADGDDPPSCRSVPREHRPGGGATRMPRMRPSKRRGRRLPLARVQRSGTAAPGPGRWGRAPPTFGQHLLDAPVIHSRPRRRPPMQRRIRRREAAGRSADRAGPACAATPAAPRARRN